MSNVWLYHVSILLCTPFLKQLSSHHCTLLGSACTVGLKKRVTVSNPLIVAEGYLFELERRGYNRHGSFIPIVSSATHNLIIPAVDTQYCGLVMLEVVNF